MRIKHAVVALLLLLVGLTTSCKPESLTEEQLEGKNISNEDLLFFLDEFVNIGLANGFDYTYVYNQSIKMEFTNDFKFGHNGQSWGINKSKIEIYINAEWFERQKAKFEKDGKYSAYVKYVIFHELAHDILNLKHKHGARLMDTKTVHDEEELLRIVLDAMKYAKDNGKNSNKGSDDAELVECEIIE